jgi:acyl-CoA synthetase (AMP-forming)/AMP-acid ligase II
MLALLNTIDFPVLFLDAIKAGLIPIAINTLLTSNDFDFILRDSRALALVVSAPLLPAFTPILAGQPFVKQVIVAGKHATDYLTLSDLLAKSSSDFTTAPTRAAANHGCAAAPRPAKRYRPTSAAAGANISASTFSTV